MIGHLCRSLLYLTMLLYAFGALVLVIGGGVSTATRYLALMREDEGRFWGEALGQALLMEQALALQLLGGGLYLFAVAILCWRSARRLGRRQLSTLSLLLLTLLLAGGEAIGLRAFGLGIFGWKHLPGVLVILLLLWVMATGRHRPPLASPPPR